jgi:hypothetical protein
VVTDSFRKKTSTGHTRQPKCELKRDDIFMSVEMRGRIESRHN